MTTKTNNTITRLERRLNAAKHKNPPSTLMALNIATGWLRNPIRVTYIGGKYWAGAGTDEFQIALGTSEEESEKTLADKGL